MSIQGINRGGAYFAAPFAVQEAPVVSPFPASSISPRAYVKAKQNCGLQNCILTVCRKIIGFVSCLFKTFCCCQEASDANADVPKVPLTPFVTPLVGNAHREQEVPKPSDLDLQPLELKPTACRDPVANIFYHGDIMINVFCHFDIKTEFPAMAQVCSAWYRVIKQACIKQLNGKKRLTMQELFLYQKRLDGKPDKDLSQKTIQEQGGSPSNDWKWCIKHCEQLEALDFSGVFSDMGFYSISLKEATRRTQKQEEMAKEIDLIIKTATVFCPHFKILDFSNCGQLFSYKAMVPGSMTKPNRLISEALKHVRQLTHLNLEGCGASLDLVHALVSQLPELVSLDFNTGWYSWQSIPQESRSESIARMGECCPKLERLSFRGLGGDKYEAKDISNFVEKFPNLTHLSMDAGVTSGGLEILAERCEKLVFFQFVFIDVRGIVEGKIPKDILKRCEEVEEALAAFRQKRPKTEISTRRPSAPSACFFLG